MRLTQFIIYKHV